MRSLFLGVALSIVSFTAFGWGQTGHRVVAKVAQNNLSKSAQKALFTIMGHESLVEASTWMDDIKSDEAYDYTHAWHYVTIPNGETYQSAEKSDKGDLYEATERMIAILKDENSSQSRQVEALRMLVHLVGDFHQPLHVGNGNDRGGNSVKIKWFYKNSNLHRIWDSGMIDSKKFSYTELAKLIDHTTKDYKDTFNSQNLDVWVEEAMQLRPKIYDIGEKKSLSYEYRYANWETVKKQLHKGGLRLAAILNDIYD